LITETNATKTTSVYSESKLLGSNAVIENGLNEKSIVLRPFGVVQDVANPLPPNASNLMSVISDASTNDVVKVKNPKAIRDLVNVNEVANATIKLLDRSMPWPKILNISSGTGHSVEEILSLVNPNIQIIHEEISYGDNYVGDTNLLSTFLDFDFDKILNVVLFGKFCDNA
jgi:nucleoside-diphosphate-sugar epimerase